MNINWRDLTTLSDMRPETFQFPVFPDWTARRPCCVRLKRAELQSFSGAIANH